MIPNFYSFLQALWNNIPKPTEPDVFLFNLPTVTVFVRAFDGRAKQSDFLNNGEELAKSIDDSSKYSKDMYFTAEYDSPFTFFDRRNEVWFVATGMNHKSAHILMENEGMKRGLNILQI